MARMLHVCLTAFLALTPLAWGGRAESDRNGRVTSLDLDGLAIPVTIDLRFPPTGWPRLPGLASARDVKRSPGSWQGDIEVAAGKRFRYEVKQREKDGNIHLDYSATALSDVSMEGVFLWVDLPIRLFGGGACEFGEGKRAGLPTERPPRRHLLSATTKTARITTDNLTLALAFDAACAAVVQDNREWDTQTYTLFVRLPGTPLRRGQSTSLNVTLRLSGEVDRSPATLTITPTERYRLDGFGGNYCFNIESPVTDYTLDHLRVAWARTEMTPAEWEPRNDNDSPQDTDWAFLESHDRPGTNLRREFLVAQKIQRKRIPYAISIWHLPEWLYAEPGGGPEKHGRKVHPDKWPELLECVGSYLLYAKRKYGVEPDLFSFNEPDWGVRVKFTPDEHRDAIRTLGAHFQRIGLRTRMLLGNVTNPRNTHTYCLPASEDAEARRHIGAVGFNSWGGGTPEHYAAWSDLADRLKVPLLVTELGVDAGAWRGRAYNSFSYGLREVRLYQDILLHARPRGTMQWEFTADYGTVLVQDGKLVPTWRFWFVKHFCDLTPPDARVLTTTSDRDDVLLTAFRGRDGVVTLHLANLGPSRPVTVKGIPEAVPRFRAVRTGEGESFADLPAVPVLNGTIALELAKQSLLTLTTMPRPE